ncbi:MAG: hypothetical protein WC006_02475 [Bacilli bacterium]
MKRALIKIWGDVVDAMELVFSILIISTTTMGLYFLAPQSDTLPLGLFFGLGGAIIGFIITIFLFKPKRIVTYEEEE